MDDPLADELRNHRTDDGLGRTDYLLIIADEHVRARRPERAVAIWQQLISEGGPPADEARVDYADFLFDEGRDKEARDEFEAVMAGGSIYSFAWGRAAEILEVRGEFDEALRWYELVAERMTAADVIDTHRVRDLLSGRRRVKWKLRLPFDGIDLLVPAGEEEERERAAELRDLLRTPAVNEKPLAMA